MKLSNEQLSTNVKRKMADCIARHDGGSGPKWFCMACRKRPTTQPKCNFKVKLQDRFQQ